MNKEKFDITGMTCSACSTRVEQCVRKLPGVSEVAHNLVLLGARWNRQQNGFHLAISGCPQIRNDTASVTVVFF